MWRIEESKPIRLQRSSLANEKELENLIKTDPSLLDQESLLIIGQQIEVIDVSDRIDLLAIDALGTPVIIEVKRGKVKNPDEMQSIRYASYVANWGHESFEKQADGFFSREDNVELLSTYLGRNGAEYEGFIQLLEEFCEQEYELNSDQRIIVVGTDVREKVLPVLMWLNKKGIDIKFVQIRAFEDKGNIFISSRTVFPIPEQEDMLVGASAAAVAKPWKLDGRDWHLKKRSSHESAEILASLVDALEEFDEVESTSWNQKFYVAIRVRSRNWIKLQSYTNQVNIWISVSKGTISKEELMEALALSEDRIDIEQKRQWDEIALKLRVDDDYNLEAFKDIAQKALDSYLKRFA
ncbi:MAG: hypothetical protein ACFFER_10440 [Candidatus Thorarchaeota archaeon]